MRKPPILGQICLISRFQKSVNCQSEKQGGCFQSTHCQYIDDSRNKRQSKTYVFTIFRDGIDTVSVSVASSCCPLKGNFTNGNWSRFLRPRSLESAPLSNNAREGPFLVLSFRITPYQAIYCPLIHGGFHN